MNNNNYQYQNNDKNNQISADSNAQQISDMQTAIDYNAQQINIRQTAIDYNAQQILDR